MTTPRPKRPYRQLIHDRTPLTPAQRPERFPSWNRFRREPRWRELRGAGRFLLKVEWASEWTLHLFRRWAVLRLVTAIIGAVSVLATVLAFYFDREERTDDRINRAWATIAAIPGASGNIGGKAGLEFLFKAGEDLRMINLNTTLLERISLPGANLAKAQLFGADLAWANLRNAYLRDANLAGAVLWGANLTGAVLANANLSGATLVDANLTGAVFAEATLLNSDLRGASFEKANLTGADFTSALLDKNTVFESACADPGSPPRGLPLSVKLINPCPFIDLRKPVPRPLGYPLPSR